MTNVIHISAARRNLAAPRLSEDSTDDFLVSFDDVFWYGEQGAIAEAGCNINDTIELGSRAELQVKHLFWRYGLRQIPTTWGALTGNWAYCIQVSGWLLRFEEGQSAAMQRLAFERHEAQCPGRGVMLQNLIAGDLDAVWEWHKANQVFEQNAIDPLLTKG